MERSGVSALFLSDFFSASHGIIVRGDAMPAISVSAPHLAPGLDLITRETLPKDKRE
jgi:hypothetical protein